MSEGEKAFIEMMRRHDIQASMYVKDLPEYDTTNYDVRFAVLGSTKIHELCEEFDRDEG